MKERKFTDAISRLLRVHPESLHLLAVKVCRAAEMRVDEFFMVLLLNQLFFVVREGLQTLQGK